MTSKQLAKLLGVSPATVSMALNGKPGVNEETRKMILEAAKEHKVSSRSPFYTSSKSICLILFQRRMTVLSYSSFINEVIQGIMQTCSASGFSVATHSILGLQNLIDFLSSIQPSDTAGILLTASELTQEDFPLLPKISLPIVLLDNSAFHYPFDCVKIDNVNSAFSAVNFLIERTRSVPGYLRSSYQLVNFNERFIGYEQALSYNGMSKNNDFIHDLLPSIESAYAEMSALLNNHVPLASCYFADQDLIAIGAMMALKDHGYKIPEDISIVGFDDIEMCAHIDPPLTTMHVPKYHFGAAAVKRLLMLIQDGTLFPIKIEMTANLIIRGSIK